MASELSSLFSMMVSLQSGLPSCILHNSHVLFQSCTLMKLCVNHVSTIGPSFFVIIGSLFYFVFVLCISYAMPILYDLHGNL